MGLQYANVHSMAKNASKGGYWGTECLGEGVDKEGGRLAMGL